MKVLAIAPHPDDEILGIGGSLAKHIANGDEVYVCIVTKGVMPLFDKNYVEDLRQETLIAHQLLGVTRTFFFDFPAVMLEDINRYEMNEQFLNIIQETEPDIVYIPHFGDMQKDHQIVAESAMVAIRPKYANRVKKVYAYETLSETEWNNPHCTNAFIPNVYQDITGYLDKKIEVMKCYHSQLLEFPNPRSLEAIEALARYRGSIVNVCAAEAFSLIREIKS